MLIIMIKHFLTSGADTDAARLYTVSRFDIHPLYNNETFENDIAIVTTNSPMNFSEKVGPVCLPFQHQSDSFAGSSVDLLGKQYSSRHVFRNNEFSLFHVNCLNNKQFLKYI